MTDYIDEIEEQDDDTGQLYEHLRIVVDKGQVPVRIDRFMAERLQHSSKPHTKGRRCWLCACERQCSEKQLQG